MILFALIPTACLSYLALGGIFALAGGLGFAICYVLDRDPTADLDPKLITNREALHLINNYRATATQDTASGHIEIGVLFAYLNKMQPKCKAVGKELSGLEYYFAQYDGTINTNDDSGRTTVIIYPTYEDDGEHIPFDPFAPMPSGDPVTVFDMNSVATTARIGAEYDSKWALDRSNMSPPRKPTL